MRLVMQAGAGARPLLVGYRLWGRDHAAIVTPRCGSVGLLALAPPRGFTR